MSKLKQITRLVEMEKLVELASATGEYYMEKCPDVARAHRHIRHKINRDEITIPNVCPECQKMEELDIHHDDYNLPGKMVFLCRDCHIDWHVHNSVRNWDGNI